MKALSPSLGCVFLFLFLQFWTPIPGIEFWELGTGIHSFCAGMGFDTPAIPRVQSRNWNSVPARSHKHIPLLANTSFGGELAGIFPCRILSHSFLSYVGFNNMMYNFEYIPKGFFHYCASVQLYHTIHSVQITACNSSPPPSLQGHRLLFDAAAACTRPVGQPQDSM
jgi:hypothetical protein